MEINAMEFKKWCFDNISPLAWSRLVLSILPELRQIGHELNDIENPSAQLVLGEIEVEAFQKTMLILYGLDLPSEVVNA